MGLDMYLYKKIYIGANYDFNNVKGEINITKQDKPIDINFNKVVYIIEDKAYWRKANAIHNWFVNNVQGGEDNCGEYYVGGEKLIELKKLCRKVLKHPEKAEELLPTCEGFFFGGTEYDEWYTHSLESTIEQLKDVKKDESFTYTSSW